MRRLWFIFPFAAFIIPQVLGEDLFHDAGLKERAETIRALTRIADPVLENLAENRLKEKIPKGAQSRQIFAPLEAFGRLLSGMAPWLELGPGTDEEGKLRGHYIRLSLRGIGNAVNPAAPDYMNFTEGAQPLVDTAFLALAMLRAPVQLWGNLPEGDRKKLIQTFKTVRKIRPGENNWVCFSAIVECALWKFSGECEMPVIERAVNSHLKWYVGDGTYGDGPRYRWDYYNSYVIQPMLLQILRTCSEKGNPIASEYPRFLARAQRYAQVQEHMISPEGTYPVIGRSSVYRFAAFQTLSLLALMHELPQGLQIGAVRSALTSVINRSLSAPGTFDTQGWLRPGVSGFQPSLCDPYISPGSLYICSNGMLQLGLPREDQFWQCPDRPWTQKMIWSGQDLPGDHAIKD